MLDRKVEYVTYRKGRGRNERKTRRFVTTITTKKTSFKPKLKGPLENLTMLKMSKLLVV